MENLNNELMPFAEQVAEQAQIIEQAARPGGALYEVAAAKVTIEGYGQLSPREVYDTIMPPKAPGTGLARYQLIEKAPARAVEAANERAADIVAAAMEVGQIRLSEQEAYDAITPEAVVVIQDGANKTSIVRRHVARLAVQEFAQPLPVYQLGSGHKVIAEQRPDGNPNAEYKLLRELAGDFLPHGKFTSFEANLATAFAEGYEVERIQQGDERSTYKRAVTLTHANNPLATFTLVEPTVGSFEGGLEAVNTLENGIDGHQIVTATNGQYRPLVNLQVETWRNKHGYNLQPSVALGDEPGDTTPYRGKEILTAPRPATAYANELATLGRDVTLYLADTQHPGA